MAAARAGINSLTISATENVLLSAGHFNYCRRLLPSCLDHFCFGPCVMPQPSFRIDAEGFERNQAAKTTQQRIFQRRLFAIGPDHLCAGYKLTQRASMKGFFAERIVKQVIENNETERERRKKHRRIRDFTGRKTEEQLNQQQVAEPVQPVLQQQYVNQVVDESLCVGGFRVFDKFSVQEKILLRLCSIRVHVGGFHYKFFRKITASRQITKCLFAPAHSATVQDF